MVCSRSVATCRRAAAQRVRARHLSVVQRRTRPDIVVVARSACGHSLRTRVKISRSLRARLARGDLRVTFDRAFDGRRRRMRGAARRRSPEPGSRHRCAPRTVSCIASATHTPSRAGAATELVGGLYGVSIGRMFFGESMFARASDASKVAFARLATQLVRMELRADRLSGHEPAPAFARRGRDVTSRIPRAAAQ